MTTALPQRPRNRRFRFPRAVSALLLREMISTYGRSPGGYLWAVLEPIAAIAILSFVFSLILRAPSLGMNFPYFYATGYLPFFFYMQISQLMAASIRFSRPLLEYPSVTFLDALVARFILNALTHLLVFVVVMAGIIIIYDLRPILDWQAIFMAQAMIIALTIGVGVMNCYLISMYQVWERIWSVLNRPMFIISGVIFIPENVPERYRDLMMLNPLAHPISEMRKGFFPTYEAAHVNTLYPFMVALVLTVLGLFILYFHHRQILTR